MPFLSTSEMNVATRRNLRHTLIDQRFQSMTMLGIFRGSDRIQKEDGGSIISQPIVANFSQAAQSYAGAETYTYEETEEFTGYELQWKQARAGVMITGMDRRKNSNRHQALSLFKNKQETALMNLFKLMAGWVFSDGSGNNGKDWDGFLAAINTASGYRTYLGIDRASNPWWQANIFDPGSPQPLSFANMMALYMACSVDEERPNLISATKAGYAQYMGMVVPGERYTDNRVGDMGFNNICFMAQPLVEDAQNPAGELWFWNIDHCRMIVHVDENFRFKDFEEPNDQDVQVGMWQVYGNFECRKPSSCGRYLHVLNG